MPSLVKCSSKCSSAVKLFLATSLPSPSGPPSAALIPLTSDPGRDPKGRTTTTQIWASGRDGGIGTLRRR